MFICVLLHLYMFNMLIREVFRRAPRVARGAIAAAPRDHPTHRDVVYAVPRLYVVGSSSHLHMTDTTACKILGCFTSTLK